MQGTEYQELAMRTNDEFSTKRLGRVVDDFIKTHDPRVSYGPGDLLNGALGLSGETGEVVDMIKKHIFHGHKLNEYDIVKELGDVLWYVALIASTIGVSLDTVMSLNIEKLKRRYPEGFSVEASVNRTE